MSSGSERLPPAAIDAAAEAVRRTNHTMPADLPHLKETK